MNGNEEHISWQRVHLTPEPPRDVPPVDPELRPEPEPEPLEEVPVAADIYQLMPLEEVEPPVVVPAEMLLPDVPVAQPVDEPPYALLVERPLAVKPKARLNSTLISTILSWCVIATIALGVLIVNHFLPDLRASVKGERPRMDSTRVKPIPGAPGEQPVPAMPGEEEEDEESDRFDPALLKFQSRYVLGCTHLPGVPTRTLYEQNLRVFNTGPAEQRLRVIVMAGELVGPSEALSELANLRSAVSLSKRDEELADYLERLYRDYSQRRFDGPSVDEEEREYIQARLGWFGDLALAPKEGSDTAARAAVLKPAKTTAFTLLGGVLGLGIIGLFGLCFLIIFLVWLFAGWTRRWLQARSPYAGIYGETFALWMVTVVAVMAGGHYLGELLHVPEESSMLFIGCLELGTLVLVFWPVLRGVPWREVRVDLGLIWGRRPLAEPFLGLGCYAMAIPLEGLGFIVMLILMWLTGQVPGVGGVGVAVGDSDFKGHPIVQELAHADTWKLIQVFFLAAVVAPIVEETFFRGVLYRHLRDLTGKFGFTLSMLFSATVAAFIFAIVHPQDLRAVPLLMAVAYGLTLAREWRGSLIPGIVMHGLHNGMLVLVLSTLLSL